MSADTAATVNAPLNFQPPVAPPPADFTPAGMGDAPSLPSFPTPAPGSFEAPPEPATVAVMPPPGVEPPTLAAPLPAALDIPETDLPVEDEYTGRSSVLVVLDDAEEDAIQNAGPEAAGRIDDDDDDIDSLPPLPT